MSNDLGLVLSGGGARGAYQAGVVQYLAEKQLEPSVISGASIGSLNGAVIASSRSIKEAAARLEKLWTSIEQDKIIKMDTKNLSWKLSLLFLFNLSAELALTNIMARKIHHMFENSIRNIDSLDEFFEFIFSRPLLKEESLALSDIESLRDILNQELTGQKLVKGTPLWVSIYPSQIPIGSSVSWLLSKVGIISMKESKYLLVQDLSPKEHIEVLLASAALPIVFPSQKIAGQKYIDGGLGGQKNRGNTPLTPLQQSGVKRAIVVHLGQGSLWDRHDYGDIEIIEVRPRESLWREGKTKSLINFEKNKISELIQLGYEDAKYHIGNALNSLRLNDLRYTVQANLESSIEFLEKDSFAETIKLLDED